MLQAAPVYDVLNVTSDCSFSVFLLQAHFIVDEMLMNGCIVETNKQNVLAPVQLLEKAL